MSARHYLGWALDDLEGRMRIHRSGNGAAIIRALIAAGGDFEVVATWEGTRYDERRFKRNGHFDQKCPQCKEGNRK